MKDILKFDTEVTPAHDLVCLANEASFNNTFFSTGLTTYAQGWKDPSDLESMLEFVAPKVLVPRRFEWRKASENSDFLVDDDDGRNPGADFKRVQFSGSIVNSKTINRGLTCFIDSDDVQDLQSALQQRLAWLLRRTIRTDLKTAIALLLAGATNTNKTWNTSADPDADLVDLIEASGDLIGFNPNRLLPGSTVWTKRFKVYRSQDNAGAYASSAMTPAQLADQLGIEEIRIARERYQATAASKGRIMTAAEVVAFYATSGVSPEDPSHIKRFVSNCADGTERRVYQRQVSEKLWAVTVERYVQTVVTSTTGLRKYTIS